MPTNSTTRTPGTSIFGSAVRAGLISAAVAGSILIGGNLYTDRGQNTVPRLSLGTGAYLVYTDYNCTNTGGALASNTRSCYIANPLSGTGTIWRAELSVNKAPNAAKVTCVTTPVGNVYGTGTVLPNMKYVGTNSGFTIVSSTGSVALTPGTGVRCWHSPVGVSGRPGAVKEQLRLWITQQYIP